MTPPIDALGPTPEPTPAPTPQPPPRAKRRWTGRILLILLVVLAVLAAGLWRFEPEIRAEWAARGWTPATAAPQAPASLAVTASVTPPEPVPMPPTPTPKPSPEPSPAPSPAPHAPPPGAIEPTHPIYAPIAEAPLAAPAPDLAPLQQRITALEARPTADRASVEAVADDLRRQTLALATRLDRLEADLKRQATAQRDERAFVLALAEIKDRLAEATPFDAPLAVLKAAGGDDPTIAPALTTLDRFATTGIVTRRQLATQLAALPAALDQPAPVPADASLWQRITARAATLIKVRRVADPAGGTPLPPGPEQTLAKALTTLDAGDLAGAIADVRSLDGAAAEHAKPWLAAAEDRLAVEAAAARLTSLALQRLSQAAAPGPAP